MIIVEPDKTAFSHRLAELFSALAKASISGHGRFNLALCGGSTPRRFHQSLGKPPYDTNIPWRKVHLFWVDERCVPSDSPDSNFGNAKKELIDKIKIPLNNVHPMTGERPPEAGAKEYEKTLMHWLNVSKEEIPVFDLILLGVGEDGHVASLFPGDEELNNTQWVKAVRGGVPDVHRLTLTYPVLNHAGNIVFLVSGKSKAGIVYQIFKHPELNLPAQRIRPVNGTVRWVLDKDAASMMDRV